MLRPAKDVPIFVFNIGPSIRHSELHYIIERIWTTVDVRHVKHYV